MYFKFPSLTNKTRCDQGTDLPSTNTKYNLTIDGGSFCLSDLDPVQEREENAEDTAEYSDDDMEDSKQIEEGNFFWLQHDIYRSFNHNHKDMKTTKVVSIQIILLVILWY